jgi:NAD(P)H-quinone oxidoreductase subunit N
LLKFTEEGSSGMAFLTTGGQLIKDLETHGAIAAYVPLEGGFEGRYRRRIRASGYQSLSITARGLGDVAAYLTGVHGVRPPHLGKKSSGSGAAVGYTYFIPPIVTTQIEQLPPKSKGLLLWIIEGHILSSQELAYLANLPKIEPRVKVVIEVGGERYFRWSPLTQVIAA